VEKIGVIDYMEKGKKLFPEDVQVTALTYNSAIHMSIE